jgi:hypothetical protein
MSKHFQSSPVQYNWRATEKMLHMPIYSGLNAVAVCTLSMTLSQFSDGNRFPSLQMSRSHLIPAKSGLEETISL